MHRGSDLQDLTSIKPEVIGLPVYQAHDDGMSVAMPTPTRPAGSLLREWRQRRRLSQLACALEAEISQKHLSFVESGRSRPSREMVLHLTERLGVPLRERNAIMLAAGYAPVFPERSLDDPALGPARAAVELILKGHESYPALAVDRRWTLLGANAAVGRLLGLVADPELLQPPVNVLRLSLAPGGLAPHIVNLAEWRGHVLERLRQQVSLTGDHGLAALHAALQRLPGPETAPAPDFASTLGGVAVPLRIRTPEGVLSLISTTTVFGTPVDVTLSELALETFFRADEETAAALRAMAATGF
jgi:transcriptional regulator with XRE-family HTH domain